MDKHIAAHEIVNLGFDMPDYFRGAGVAHTDWDNVYVGIGDNAKEAYEDACDQCGCDDWDTYKLPNKPRGISKSDKVSDYQDEPEDGDDNDGMAYEGGYIYVALYVREGKRPKDRRVIESEGFRRAVKLASLVPTGASTVN